MKTFIIYILLVALSSCNDNSTIQDARQIETPALFVDNEYGFRNHHFGDHISTFEDIKFLKKGDMKGVKVYGLEKAYENERKLENIELVSIGYYFYHDSLCQVTLICNAKQSNDLLEIAKQRYGGYTQIVPGKEVYQWKGKKALATYISASAGDGTYASIVITSAEMLSRTGK